MDIYTLDFVKEFIRTCEDGFRFGWHDHNNGNLSYRLKPEEMRIVSEHFCGEQTWRDIGIDIPGLGDEYFLITGSNIHFRNIAHNPKASIGIIKLDEDGEDYSICFGEEGFRAPAGLSSHLMALDVKKHTDDHRVVYHCHTPNLNALTYVLPLNSSMFTKTLWQMYTSSVLVFPRGIRVVEWMMPGSRELALATGECLKNVDAVIWAHHGLLVSGSDFSSVFGLVHTIERAAEITVKVMQIGGKKQGITGKNIRLLAKSHGVRISI